MAEGNGNPRSNDATTSAEGVEEHRFPEQLSLPEHLDILDGFTLMLKDGEDFDFSTAPDLFERICRVLAHKKYFTGDPREIEVFTKLLRTLVRRALNERIFHIVKPLVKVVMNTLRRGHLVLESEATCLTCLVHVARGSKDYFDIVQQEFPLQELLKFSSRKVYPEALQPLAELIQRFAEYHFENTEALTSAYCELYQIFEKKNQDNCSLSTDICATTVRILKKKHECVGAVAMSKILPPLLRHARIHEYDWSECTEGLLELIDQISSNISPLAISLMNDESVQLMGRILSAPEFEHLYERVCKTLIEYLDAGVIPLRRVIKYGVLNTLILRTAHDNSDIAVPAQQALDMFLTESPHSYIVLAIQKSAIGAFCELLCSRRTRIIVYGLAVVERLLVKYFSNPSPEYTEEIMRTPFPVLLRAYVDHANEMISRWAYRCLYLLPRDPGTRPLTPPVDSSSESCSDDDFPSVENPGVE